MLCYFLFYAAWLLFPKKTYLSTFLFLISFNINSLLCFYILPYLEKYFINNKSNINLKSFLKFIRKISLYQQYQYFLYCKVIFFKPYSIFEGYNQTFNIKTYFLSSSATNRFFQITVSSLLLLFFITALFLYILSK